jgi:UDP-hydrolysing UDP-N-acetyl-D-glucosamine 2-epimerase
MKMKKRKVCIVVTARPSYARIKSVMSAINQRNDLELQLVVAASALLERYGSAVNYMKEDGFEPQAMVYMVLEGENLVTAAKSTGLGIVELATVFDNLNPDIVISVADRYETIATAIASSYSNIPLAHVQGGEVTGSIDEKVRHAVTKLSDIHFVTNDDSFKRVKKMGEEEDKIHVTGCPSIDLANNVSKNKIKDFNPFELFQKGVGQKFDLNKDYVVVMQHPVTTELDDSFEQINETLMAIHKLKIPTFWFWPNVDAGSDKISKGIRIFREKNDVPFIHFFKNMSPENFLKLLINSKCLIGNSSTGIRECSFLGIPVVNIGDRQKRRLRAENVLDVDYNSLEISNAIKSQIKNGKYVKSTIYGDGNAGEKIAELLATVKFSIEKQITY